MTVFRDEGGVVIMIVGPEEKGVEGRYVYFMSETCGVSLCEVARWRGSSVRSGSRPKRWPTR